MATAPLPPLHTLLLPTVLLTNNNAKIEKSNEGNSRWSAKTLVLFITNTVNANINISITAIIPTWNPAVQIPFNASIFSAVQHLLFLRSTFNCLFTLRHTLFSFSHSSIDVYLCLTVFQQHRHHSAACVSPFCSITLHHFHIYTLKRGPCVYLSVNPSSVSLGIMIYNLNK